MLQTASAQHYACCCAEFARSRHERRAGGCRGMHGKVHSLWVQAPPQGVAYAWERRARRWKRVALVPNP